MGLARKTINIIAAFDLQAFSSSSQNLTRQLRNTGLKLSAIGAGISAALTLPILGLGKLAANEFAEFEQAMKAIEAISGGENIDALTQKAKDLGISTMFTAQQVAGLMLQYKKLGFSIGEIDVITESTLNLAQATGEDLSEAAIAAGGTLRAFGYDVSQFQRVVDTMAFSIANSALDIEKWKVSMSKIAPIASVLGFTIEEVASMEAILADRQIEASIIGTSLRKIFTDLAVSGMTYAEAMDQINKSTNPVAKATELFQVRAANAAITLASNTDKMEDFHKSLVDAGGASKEMAKIMNDSLNMSFIRLKSAASGVAIQFGETLAPLLRNVADYAAKLAIRFGALDDTTRKMIITVLGIVAVVGPVITVIGLLTLAMSALATAVNLALWPIAVVIASLIALSVAAVWMKDNADAMARGFERAFANMKNAVSDAVLFILKKYQKMKVGLGWSTTGIDETINSIIQAREDLDKLPPIEFKGFKFSEGGLKEGVAKYEAVIANLFGSIIPTVPLGGDKRKSIQEELEKQGKFIRDSITKVYQSVRKCL
jgi:phage-related minor tail protein